MKYTYKRENLSDTHLSFSVTVDYSEFEAEKEKRYEELAKDVEVKGFRKGNAPRNIVEPMVMKEMIEKAVEILIPKSFSEIAEKEQFEIASTPEYKVSDISKDKGISYTVDVYIYNSFEIPDRSKFKIAKFDKIDATDEELEKSLKAIFDLWKRDNPNEKDLKLNDEFVKKLKLKDVNNLQDLKAEVKKEVLDQKKRAEEQAEMMRVLQEATEKAGVKLPENVIKKIEENVIPVIKKQYQAMKKPSKTEQEMIDEVIKEEQDRLKNEIFLSRYGRKKEIKLPKEYITKLRETYKDQKQLYYAMSSTFLSYVAGMWWKEMKGDEKK